MIFKVYHIIIYKYALHYTYYITCKYIINVYYNHMTYNYISYTLIIYTYIYIHVNVCLKPKH